MPTVIYVGAALTNASSKLSRFFPEFKSKLRGACDALVIEWIGPTSEKIPDIYHRDFRNIAMSDAVIMLVDEPSFGVGIMIGETVHQGKPFLCLHRDEKPVSRMLIGAIEAGRGKIEVYRDMADAIRISVDFIKSVKK